MSPRILLQYSILAHLSEKYKFFLKLCCDKMINLLTFKIKYDKVLNGEELQSADMAVNLTVLAIATKRLF